MSDPDEVAANAAVNPSRQPAEGGRDEVDATLEEERRRRQQPPDDGAAEEDDDQDAE